MCKKLYILSLFLTALAFTATAQNVSINKDGAAPDPSAMLDVSDTASGFLLPRMTTDQMNAIVSPANGLLIYNTDSIQYFYWNGGVWTSTDLGSSGQSSNMSYQTIQRSTSSGGFSVNSERLKSTAGFIFNGDSLIQVIHRTNYSVFKILEACQVNIDHSIKMGAAQLGARITVNGINNTGSFTAGANYRTQVSGHYVLSPGDSIILGANDNNVSLATVWYLNITAVAVSAYGSGSGSSSSSSSLESDTEWEEYTPTFTGLGTVTNVKMFYRREGTDLLLRGNFTKGIGTAVVVTMTLPSSLTILSSVEGIELAGSVTYGGGAYNGHHTVLIQADSNHVAFGYSQNASGGSTKGFGNVLYTTGFEQSLFARVPIEGWGVTSGGISSSSSSTSVDSVAESGIVLIKDVKSNGTGGGTFTSGAWQDRDLNTLQGDTSFVNLSSNQITLDAGIYSVEWSAPAFLVSTHKTRLYNVTQGTNLLIGSNENNGSSSDVQTLSFGSGVIEANGTDVFSLQHRSAVTRASDGFGVATSYGVDEIFSQIKFVKLDQVFGSGVSSSSSSTSIDTLDENHFSARISSVGGITSENRNFISSVNNSATGTYDITFVAGFFTVAPKVSGSVEEGTVSVPRILTVRNVSTSGCTIYIHNETDGANEVSSDFGLDVSRQGSDYKYNTSGGSSSGSSNTNSVDSAAESGVLILRDVKASGNDGGTFTSGSWQTRDLNSKSGDTSFVSLSSNEFTLQSGVYLVEATAPGFRVGLHRSRIYNVTDAAEEIRGQNQFSINSASANQTSATLAGLIDITSSKTFRLEHRAQSTQASNGFGATHAIGGEVDIYSEVKITKLDQVFGGGGNSSSSSDTSALISDADNNTIIHTELSPNDDTIRFFNAGVQTMTITPTGNVGIGDTQPNRPLEVFSETTTPIEIKHNNTVQYTEAVRAFNDSLGAGDEFAYVLGKSPSTNNAAWMGYRHYSDGNDTNALIFNIWNKKRILNITGQRRVGINTLTPEKDLDVNGAATIDTLNINSVYTLPSTAPTSGQVLRYNGSDVEWGAISNLYDSDGTISSARTITQNSNTITFNSSLSSGSAMTITNNVSGISGSPLTVTSSGTRSIGNSGMIINNTVTKVGGSNSTKVGLEINSTGSWGPVTTNQPNVGIKITASGADNNYALQLIDGSQALNRVLTSDASGNASWQTKNTFYDNDATLSSDRIVTLGTSNLEFNLNSTGDFNIQDNGVNIFEVGSTGETILGGDMTWRDINTSGTILARLIDDTDDGYFSIYENGSESIRLDANTGVTFNEQGFDRDFRVESFSQTSMLHVDASANAVGIGTGTPSQELDVEGDIEIDGDYTYESAKTDYRSVSPNAFISNATGTVYISGTSTGNSRYFSGGVAGTVQEMFADVQLPNGAVVTKVDFNVLDNDATYNVSGNFVRKTLGGSTIRSIQATTTTTAGATGAQDISASGLSITIDNSLYAYYLIFNTYQNTSDLRIMGVLITYTVTKTD